MNTSTSFLNVFIFEESVSDNVTKEFMQKSWRWGNKCYFTSIWFYFQCGKFFNGTAYLRLKFVICYLKLVDLLCFPELFKNVI